MATETDSKMVLPPDDPADVKLRAEIDRSARLPVLFFFTSAIAWLVAATFLGFIASMKAHWPGFLDFDSLHFMNYGRIRPAFMNALVYGFAIQAGLGVSIWLMARLCRAEVRNPITLIVVGHFWNAGVALGVLSIFGGFGTSMEWMDFPKFVWPILFVAYTLIAIWMITMFQRRRTKGIYISQWYILAACFWFPWVYLTANLFIHHLPGAAVMATAINAWFQNGIIFLVLTPIGLAAAYYLIPKILGRPIYSYQLALLGFWGLAIFASWAGMQRLMGGPVPAWMPAVGGAATILMLMPVIAVAVNLHMTTRGARGMVQYSPTFRCTVIGAFCYTAFNVLGALFCLFPVGKLTQLTHGIMGFQILAIYAFFGMTMFGAIYFIVPRLTGKEWKSAKMINFHFWFTTYGVIAVVAMYLLAGFNEAEGLLVWNGAFKNTVELGSTFLRGASLAWIFILVASGVFFFHLIQMALGFGSESTEPTLLGHPHDDDDEDTETPTGALRGETA